MHLPVKHVQSDEVHAAVQSQVSASPPSSLAAVRGFQSSSSVPLQLWHHRLGHPNATKINLLLSQGLISSCNKEPLAPVCSSCQSAKSLQLPFSNSNKCTSSFLELIHSDLWGPSNVPSLSGSPYYVCLWMTTPDIHGFFFLKKSDVLDILVKFVSFSEAHFGKKIRFLRSGEFTSQKFRSFCLNHGIKQQFSCPHTPSQNGVAERKHRHISESGLAMLFHSGLPLHLWPEAFHLSLIHI